jgi:hypothetical protein
MDMAGRIQKELEIVLLGIEIHSLRGKDHSTHILQSSLLWPRCGIARKNGEKELPLLSGAADLRSSSWCGKILFKEVVENLFGLELKLTVSLSQSELTNLGRFIAGKTLDLVADEIEDRIPAGELASLPVIYFSKNLLKSKVPAIIVSGTLDLDARQFNEGEPVELEMPMLSQREVVRQQRLGGRKGPVKYTRKILLGKGESDGVARLGFRVLERK